LYFLKPKPAIEHAFGLDREVILAIPLMATRNQRTMQAIDSIVADESARGRVDQTIFFLYLTNPNAPRWVDAYLTQNPDSRITVVFTPADVTNATQNIGVDLSTEYFWMSERS
jgi:hypothetical protein